VPPDQHVNGELTVGENIADLSEVTVALRSYRLSLGDRQLPVLDGFTGEQRFFLGCAQVWRAKVRDEKVRSRLLQDPHSPVEFRVNGVVSNLPEYYTAFDVKESDKLFRPPTNASESGEPTHGPGSLRAAVLRRCEGFVEGTDLGLVRPAGRQCCVEGAQFFDDSG